MIQFNTFLDSGWYLYVCFFFVFFFTTTREVACFGLVFIDPLGLFLSQDLATLAVTHIRDKQPSTLHTVYTGSWWFSQWSFWMPEKCPLPACVLSWALRLITPLLQSYLSTPSKQKHTAGLCRCLETRLTTVRYTRSLQCFSEAAVSNPWPLLHSAV